MSIPQDNNNGNTPNQRVHNITIFVIFIAVGLLCFAIGRISAFNEYAGSQDQVIITNTTNLNSL